MKINLNSRYVRPSWTLLINFISVTKEDKYEFRTRNLEKS